MYNCFTDNGFTQYVNHSSLLNTPSSGNILDLIFSNDPLAINVDQYHCPIGNSDHATIKFSIYVPTQGSSVFTPSIKQIESEIITDSSIKLPCYDWSSANYQAINQSINMIDWHYIFGYNFTADTLWNAFIDVIWPIIALYVPHKYIQHNKKYRPRQYPKKIRQLLIRKAAIWRQLKKSNTPALLNKYRTLSNLCKLEIINFDTAREEKILSANNLGAFYKFINNKTNNHSGIAPLKTADGTLLTSDLDRANLLNDYFKSVFTKENDITPKFPSRFGTENKGISDINISHQIIKRILSHLKTNAAAGPDGLPPIFFHFTASSLSFPLSLLFRTFLSLRTLPAEWKVSIITPKFKKGAPSNPANYRPIALTCTCCKILETIISQDIMKYLITHNLITKNQHGFIKKHSTSTNLLECLNDWSISLY